MGPVIQTRNPAFIANLYHNPFNFTLVYPNTQKAG